MSYDALTCLNKYTTAKPFGISFEQQFKIANYYFPVTAEILSDTLDLKNVILSNYLEYIVKRCLKVLKYTTYKYFNTKLKILL